MSDPQRPPASFSLSAVWEDAGRMLAANASLITAIAGAFLFLPAVAEARFFPPPSDWTTAAEWVAAMSEHVGRNWPWLLLTMAMTLTGIIALYLLLLATPRLTVANAVSRAVTILPFYVVLTLVLSMVVGLGFAFFIVPGIFLLGKLALATPIMIAETPRAPFTALQRAWERSSGRAWSIAALVVLVYLVAMLVSFAVRVGFGTVVLFALGNEGIGALLLALLQGLVVTAVTVLLVVVIAAAYRALPPQTIRAPGPA